MDFFLRVVTALVFFVTIVISARTERNQLVTMTKAELMEIINCISKSNSGSTDGLPIDFSHRENIPEGNAQNQATCDRLAVCNNIMPEQVVKAYEKCNTEINPNGKWRCNKKEALYTSEEIPIKIFDCISANTSKLNAVESKKMVEFETCARALYIGACPSPKRV